MKSEYKVKENKEEYFADSILGIKGRMVGGSKSIYSYDNPDNYVIFNANVYTIKEKIWYGDLDITLDAKKLFELSTKLNDVLYIFYEMDGRFDNENKVDYDKALFIVKGYSFIKMSEYAELVDGVVKKKKIEYLYTKEVKVYEKKNFSKGYELPDLSKIKVKRGYSTIEQFQKAFVKIHGLEKAKEVYLSLYVPSEYYEQLENLIKKNAKRDFPDLHPVKIEQTIAGEMLDGPMEFEITPKWAKQGYGYERIK